MPRAIPEDRLRALLTCAARVFIERGFRRSQIADVAEALGVAKGTLYLYVESKEALFHAALRYADEPAPDTSALDLPLAAPDPAAFAAELRERLAEEALPEALTHALDAPAGDPMAELEAIVSGLYDTAFRRRTAIQLIDRCARDHPELAAVFYTGGRVAQLDALARYLTSRIAAGTLPAVEDVAIAARFVVETIATWAVHIHWDPAPQPIDPDQARRTVVQLVVRALGAGT